MRTKLQLLILFVLTTYYAIGQSECTPIAEVNFPGGRVVMSFDGNVHDDDDIVAMAYSAGLFWAAGLQDKVVQIEYNNHVCDTGVNESDGTGAGAGDDSANMRATASGAISNFGYSSTIFYDYERQGSTSSAKMAAEIEKSTASNPLWILAGGPMETVWRGFERANKGFDHVVVISHSRWNENHTHCSDAHNYSDLKNKYQGKGVFFVENCDNGGCSSSNKLNDQNGGFNSAKSNWEWMRNSDKEYNRWIYSRNPWSSRFDPSDAGMAYFLITGGPFNGGNKTPDHNDAKKLLENPCQSKAKPEINKAPELSFNSPSNGQTFKAGANIAVEGVANDSDGSISEVALFINDTPVGKDYQAPYQWSGQDENLANLKKGNYVLKLVAKDNDGATTTKTLRITVEEEETNTENSTPVVVSITSPKDNQTFAVGDRVDIDVSTTEKGNVVKHQIFLNDNLVDTDGDNFTSHTIENIQEGTYDIRVEATNEAGVKATKSVAISVVGIKTDDKEEEVKPEQNPEEEKPEQNPDIKTSTFNFISPADNANFDVGETITVDLAPTASGSDIVKYQIFVNENLVDTDPSNFTAYRITHAQKGTYTVRAEATEASGAKTVKTSIVQVGGNEKPTVEVPSVNETPIRFSVSPEDGSSFLEGTNVSVNVSAAANSSSIIKYQIYVNGNLVDTDPAYFTPYVITNVERGTYAVKVEVTDEDGHKETKTLQFNVGSTSVGLVARINNDSANLLNDENLSLRIAPNPVEGSQMNVFQKTSSNLRITSVYGVLVKQINDAGESERIDVSGLAPGLYILESDTEKAKFIISD
ncbi:Por secretion system C-terminal sorting domain-containing protein [Pricia antarctica]|uniref:Por secretion system C-terminal sorting domain-containing protein n=1 Tax=Pricia antarctica TaxID=641691 RepID=A0A1G7I8T1_9FLAO|nr:Ig-like domain-containing protein [Pricia antarctica]SDF09120.1 Por secretion system C-terminal sorting domain-containing protein [Pricia antarctica]